MSQPDITKFIMINQGGSKTRRELEDKSHISDSCEGVISHFSISCYLDRDLGRSSGVDDQVLKTWWLVISTCR